MAKTVELLSRRVLMHEKYLCEHESVSLHRNAWDPLNVQDLIMRALSLTNLNMYAQIEMPCAGLVKLHAFGVKVLPSRTNFPYIFYKFVHFHFSYSPYISLKLWQLQLQIHTFYLLQLGS